MGLPPMSCSRSQRTRAAPVFARARRLSKDEVSRRASGLEPRPITHVRRGRTGSTHRPVRPPGLPSPRPRAQGSRQPTNPPGAHGLPKGLSAHERARSHRVGHSNDAPTAPAPSLWIDLPFDHVLIRCSAQSAHRSVISRFRSLLRTGHGVRERLSHASSAESRVLLIQRLGDGANPHVAHTRSTAERCY